MALGYQNPFYLKQAQQKHQSLYNGKVLLEKHDPPSVYDSEETLELAQEKVDESLAKHKALELEIERLLRAVVIQDIMSIVQNNSVVDTSNLQTKLEPQLFDKVSEQKDTTCGTSANTKFAKQSILGIPPSSSRPKLYAVTPLPKSTAIPKVGENDLPLIDPRKTSRKDNFVPNKPTNVSVRTNPITVSQPHVIIKKVVNSDLNGFSSTGVDITTKTRRPQPRRNTKNDRVKKPKKVGFTKRLASPKPSKPRMYLRWSPTRRIFDLWGKLIGSIDSECYPNMFMVRQLGLFQAYDQESKASHQFHLSWGITCSRLGNRTTNFYTINLHDMASPSPIYLMAHATSIKSWLWHQRLSHLMFDTINDLTRNDLVTGLPKFKYDKEHLCPSCE
ncbi:retrovirus-related pol polyprotein from transposon TNT 1-94 [Tanacetum coccineum]